MATLKTDQQTNDLVVQNNRLVIIDGADEVTQRVRARLRMFRGEWFLDTERGTPYFQTIFAKGTSSDAIAAAIKREILTVLGVVELLKYSQEINPATRLLTVDFTISAYDGKIVDISEAF